MFGKSFKLFSLFGFEVKLDLSWLVLGILITWSLASGLFPYYYNDLSVQIYWIMGAAGAVGLFLSIIFHEFSHSVTARRFGLPIKGITLFIFGGVAEMHEEPPSPKAEFFMAIAGPLSSVFIGAILYAVSAFASSRLPIAAYGVLQYLAMINFILAGFNMVPAFPLDGGRVLRSALWKWKNNIRWATKISSQIGSLFGIILIMLGLLNVLTGNIIGGIWYFILGIFLRNASEMSYQHILMRKVLEGEKVSSSMNRELVTVPSSVSLDELVEEYFYKYHFKMLPVVDGERLTGCIKTGDVKNIPRSEWNEKKVSDIAVQCTESNTILPDADTMKAFSLMNRTKNSSLMVVKDNKLMGIITLKDIMTVLSVRLDFDENIN
ncbi:MAG: M50 family metallopeptidase [Nitrospirota bacterium]